MHYCKLSLFLLLLCNMYLLWKWLTSSFAQNTDLVVSEKCSVKLTDENFKSVIESNGIVISTFCF